MLAIHVRDNGPGIPAEIASSLFSMFSRGDRSNAAPDGLGIGLAVAQRILGLHGGAIELVPDGRPGCCFKILLPLS
jgi:signal transduction histidine kinase